MQTRTPTAWQESPRARTLFSRLDRAHLRKVEPASVWNGLGVVPLEYRGANDRADDTLEALEKLRRAAISKAFGKDFIDCESAAECEVWIEFQDMHVSVAAAIDEHFAKAKLEAAA